MYKNDLLKSAQQIPQVSNSTCIEYQQKGDMMIMSMNDFMLKRSDLSLLIGEHNEDMMKDNHANHIRFIVSILRNYNPEVLVDTVLWVFRAYRSHGFTTNYWAAQLNAWINILKDTLSTEAYREVFLIYEWMQVNIPVFVMLSDESLNTPNSMH